MQKYRISKLNFRSWAVMDSNHRSRKTAELQSAPFGHSGNCPKPQLISELRVQSYNNYLILPNIFTIFNAVTAPSTPLLPQQPPARSVACCIVKVVNTLNITGHTASALSCVMP